MRPSASSEARKALMTHLKNRYANTNSTGTISMDSTVSLAFFPSSTLRAVTIITSVFTTDISCTDRKRRTVSTSEVQRCTRSPVSARIW